MNELCSFDDYDQREISIFKKKDFKIQCFFPSMFLIMMSILRNSRSIDAEIYPLIIISEEYYRFLNFQNPQIKFLRIH